MPDDNLTATVDRAKRGDTVAFDKLVRQFQTTAIAYARTMLSDASLAEDAAQEAFVQAWIDLPRLNDPSAFGSWLRRIVFKFCDRVRRSTRSDLPLDDALALRDNLEPSVVVELADEAARVRAAVDALPASLREITFLYYMTGRDVKEVASFLELAPSTVKNRLHAARASLRKELLAMVETTMEQEKPAKKDEFAGAVLARVLREFQRQEKEDIHSADRGLLDEGRQALFAVLAKDEPLDTATVRDAFLLYWRKWDLKSLSALLMQYLGQPLDDSEAAWARLHVVNAISAGNEVGAWYANREFLTWLDDKSPELSYEWPFYPAVAKSVGPVLDRDALRIMCLGSQVQHASCLPNVWRNHKALDDLGRGLDEIPVSTNNLQVRLWEIQVAVQACIYRRAADRDFDRAHAYVRAMFHLAESCQDPLLRPEFRSMALVGAVTLASKEDDEDAFISSADELAVLLDASEATEAPSQAWVRRERYSLAWRLMDRSQFARALPLWKCVVAQPAPGEKDFGGWDWMGYAGATWKTTGDRAVAINLLKEASARSDAGLAEPFKARPEFADVKDDPDFLAALSRQVRG